jgi:hypothetical protein
LSLPGKEERKNLVRTSHFWVSMEFIASAPQMGITTKLDPDFTTAYKNNMVIKENNFTVLLSKASYLSRVKNTQTYYDLSQP